MIKFIISGITLAVMGILFAVAGIFAGAKILGSNDLEFGALGLAIGGAIIGYFLGTIAGLVLIKKFVYQRGSILLGLAGAILGIAAVTILAGPLNLFSNSAILIVAYLIVVTTFATGGLNLKR